MLSRPLISRFCWGLSSAATTSLAFLNYRRTFFWKPKQFFSKVNKSEFQLEGGSFKEIQSFGEMQLPSKLKEKLSKLYPVATEIQRKTMGVILGGADLIGVAKTGSGKTLAYGLPTLLRIKQQCQPARNMHEGPSYLVLCPTRELAIQIEDHLKLICSDLELKINTVYGGADRFGQLMKMRQGCDVLIATPGRLLDFLNADKFTLDRVKFLTLDEADRILEVGYEEQIIDIAKRLPMERQTTLFTATWQKKVQKVFSNYMNAKPEYVQVGDGETSFNLDIKQSFEMASDSREKLNSLLKLLNQNQNAKFLVFTNMKSTAERLSNQLSDNGQQCVVLSGDLTQSQRTNNLSRFRTGRSRILIATDVASRGLDISDVGYVINFDFPLSIKTYIHRIGRTGRAGKQGKSVTYLDEQAGHSDVQELVDLHKKHEVTTPKELIEFMSLISDLKPSRSKQRSTHRPRQDHHQRASQHTGWRSNKFSGQNRDERQTKRPLDRELRQNNPHQERPYGSTHRTQHHEPRLERRRFDPNDDEL